MKLNVIDIVKNDIEDKQELSNRFTMKFADLIIALEEKEAKEKATQCA